MSHLRPRHFLLLLVVLCFHAVFLDGRVLTAHGAELSSLELMDLYTQGTDLEVGALFVADMDLKEISSMTPNFVHHLSDQQFVQISTILIDGVHPINVMTEPTRHAYYTRRAGLLRKLAENSLYYYYIFHEIFQTTDEFASFAYIMPMYEGIVFQAINLPTTNNEDLAYAFLNNVLRKCSKLDTDPIIQKIFQIHDWLHQVRRSHKEEFLVKLSRVIYQFYTGKRLLEVKVAD